MKLGTWKWLGFVICVLWAPSVNCSALTPLKPLEVYGRKIDPTNPLRPTIADVKKIRKDYSIADLDGLLAKLKSDPKFQPLFERPVLMFKSESLLKDFISKSFPRAIFHIDGFLLAVITDPKSGWAYQTLEMAEFNPKTSRWRAERITFGEHSKDLASCSSCHGTPYTPKWGSYGLWVGAVGGLFDVLSSDDKTRLSDWKRSENPRLSWIANLYQPRGETNSTFTQHISALQSRSMMNAFITHGIFDRYSHLIRGLSLGCKNIESFFPAQGDYTQASLETRAGFTFASSQEKVLSAVETDFAAKKAILQEEYQGYSGFESLATNFDLTRLSHTAWLRLVLESRGADSVDIRRWSLSEKPGEGTYNFEQGIGGLGDFYRREFLPVYETENPKYYPLCDDLAEKSVKKLSPVIAN